MPGGRATATTVGMHLGIIQSPATDTIGIGAALNPGTGNTTTAAPMLCPGTAGMHLHITVMGPVLGEIANSPTFRRFDPEITSQAQSERGAVGTAERDSFRLRAVGERLLAAPFERALHRSRKEEL